MERQTMQTPEKFENVTVRCKANIYFDGKVVSHAVQFSDGSEKTLGLIFPGAYHFNTNAPERMEVTAGSCTVQITDTPEKRSYSAGEYFDVPAKSGFDISVADGIMEYVCSYR